MRRPLQGCRVLDFGIITAGAATSALLADLGAEVIKIESPTYRDPFRAWTSTELSTEGGAASPPFFRSNNRGKRGISIDLKRPAGRAALLGLVGQSHVVLDNFRRGVLDRLGLGRDALRQANPDIILLAISGQGATGPDAGQVSYGSTLEAVAGLAALTGYPGGPPVVSGRELNYPDQVVALFAAGAVLAAWLGRGRGAADIDVCQRELTSFLIGERFLAPEAAGRCGNTAPEHALQRCFRGADERWVAVTVGPAAVPALLACLGADPGAPLEAALDRWMLEAPAAQRAETLARAGIAAAPVLGGNDLATAAPPPWQHAFGTAPDGALVKAMPFALESAPFAIRRDAPGVGQDTEAVLREVAGYGDAEIDALLAEQAIECRTGQRDTGSPSILSAVGLSPAGR